MTNKKLLKNRLVETLGLILIGDGMVGLFDTRRHMRLWRRGPEPYQKVMESLINKPGVVRLLSGAEITLGFWLASRQKTR